MTREEIFTEFVKHLSQQNRPSKDNSGQCFYRSRDRHGNTYACAVGMFIPDETYIGDFEENTVYHIVENFPEMLPDFIVKKQKFFRDLQCCHDSMIGSVEAPWIRIQRESIQEILLIFCEESDLPKEIVLNHFPIDQQQALEQPTEQVTNHKHQRELELEPA